MEELLSLLQEFIDYLGGISKVFLYGFVIFIVFIGIYFLLDKARKTIIFSPIINRFDKEDSEFGKSLAELLLFKLKFIYNKAYAAFQNAILFSPNYAEAINDKAMIFLVTEFENYNISRAIELHQEALSHLHLEENRKNKLIDLFKKRMVDYGLNYEDHNKKFGS